MIKFRIFPFYLRYNTIRQLFFFVGLSLIVACSSTKKPPEPIKLPWREPKPIYRPPILDELTAFNKSEPDNSLETNTSYFGNVNSYPVPAKKKRNHSESAQSGVEIIFRDADIHAVIDAILGDALKLNYTIDPAIQGKLTLRTKGHLSKSALIPALEAALLSVSATIVQQGGMYQVIPLDVASQRAKGVNLKTPNSPLVPGYGVDIIPLRFANAKEMLTIIESIFPKGTVLRADEVYNHLVVAGISPDRAAIEQMVNSFDVDWLRGMNFALYPIEHSNPSQLIDELKEIFQSPINMIGSRVRFVPLDRIHAILGIALNRADLEQIDTWIKRLDRVKTEEKRVFVYNLQSGNSKQLAAALRQLLVGTIVGGDQSDVTDNSEDTSTTPGWQANQSQPVPSDPMGQTGRPYLPYGPYLNPGARQTSKLVSNDETNSLLYFGTEAEFNVIKDALRQLDVTPRQVMIEAILAEVTLNDDLRYGVQWFFGSKTNSVELNASDTAISSLFPGFSYVYSGGSDVKVILNALQSKTDVRVISAPKLSVLNNQKATLQVGDQVPILTQTSQSTISPGAPIVSSIQMRDTGVILDISPRINENGSLILEVSQEVSDVAKTVTSGINSPTIQKRKIQTSVLTNDGYTVALGGLIRDNINQSNSGVPLLKDIPYIGNLFRDNASSNKRTELIVLMVPHIMRNQGETQSVVDEMVKRLDSAAQAIDRVLPIKPNPKH